MHVKTPAVTGAACSKWGLVPDWAVVPKPGGPPGFLTRQPIGARAAIARGLEAARLPTMEGRSRVVAILPCTPHL